MTRPNPIDLRPLLADPPAAQIVLLARGQLNRAFRRHGLVPPDALALDDSTEAMALDDPAAQGIDAAMARYGEDFLAWAGAMPAKLVPPLLDMLRQAQERLHSQNDHNGPATALRAASDFLSACLQPDPRRDAAGSQVPGG